MSKITPCLMVSVSLAGMSVVLIGSFGSSVGRIRILAPSRSMKKRQYGYKNI